MDIKPYWMFVAGFVVLLMFVVLIRMPRPQKPMLGPGGTRREWRHQPWMYPGWHYEGFTSGSDAKFTMFGVDWCPHCVKAKPEFLSLGPRTTIGGQSVTCQYVNPESDKEAARGFEIEGYPTFYLEKGGQKLKYSGPRNADGFREFLEQQLSA